MENERWVDKWLRKQRGVIVVSNVAVDSCVTITGLGGAPVTITGGQSAVFKRIPHGWKQTP